MTGPEWAVAAVAVARAVAMSGVLVTNLAVVARMIAGLVRPR